MEPVVIAAGGDFQMLTQGEDRVIVFHGVDPFIALGDGSERMLSVFLNVPLVGAGAGSHTEPPRAGFEDRPPSRA
jgi:hypothetical protein